MGIIHNFFLCTPFIHTKKHQLGRWAWSWADAPSRWRDTVKSTDSSPADASLLLPFLRALCFWFFSWPWGSAVIATVVSSGLGRKKNLLPRIYSKSKNWGWKKKRRKKTKTKEVWREYMGSCSEGKQSVGGVWSAGLKSLPRSQSRPCWVSQMRHWQKNLQRHMETEKTLQEENQDQILQSILNIFSILLTFSPLNQIFSFSVFSVLYTRGRYCTSPEWVECADQKQRCKECDQHQPHINVNLLMLQNERSIQ